MKPKEDSKWITLNVKPEDAVILDKITKETGVKKYMLVRKMLKNTFPQYCTNTN